MKNTQFRTPLIQSAAVLGGVLILFAIIASSSANGSEGGFLSVIFGIGNLILFAIGMVIALLFSIGLLIAIFLAAVAMVNPEQASQMYSDLKKNFSPSAIALNRQCCENSSAGIDISKEEYDKMKQEIAEIQEKNKLLQTNINKVTADNSLLQSHVDTLNGENSALKMKIDDLSAAVENLQGSEKEIKNLVDQLTKKVQAGADQDLKDQLKKLEKLQDDTHLAIDTILERLNTLESGLKQTPTSGIFTYIDKKEEQTLFIQKVEEALIQEMTYAQIDDYLTKTLPPALDKIIKDHPSLTKSYIRDQRRD